MSEKIEISIIDRMTKTLLEKFSDYIYGETFECLTKEETEDVISFAERSIDIWKQGKPNLGFKKG